ncbi:hypothetical protein RRG08_059043 [Elysia crispata]|uniref:Uncharacterized protein n=1 Tax=Elysia crispata TaxID=231223 RepID=A0AAE1DFF6_9GAST|nr:hypothetical protein RRG08_059043 [Elysia crispata]
MRRDTCCNSSSYSGLAVACPYKLTDYLESKTTVGRTVKVVAVPRAMLRKHEPSGLQPLPRAAVHLPLITPLTWPLDLHHRLDCQVNNTGNIKSMDHQSLSVESTAATSSQPSCIPLA